MSANPKHSNWRDKMPNKLQKHLERLLPKFKTTTRCFSHLPPPKQFANSTKSMIFRRCNRSRTLSITVPDQIQAHYNPQSNDDAATLADVDRFLFENFSSLFHKDVDEKTEEQEEIEIRENCEEFSYGSLRFSDPIDQIRSNQRFFASPRKSSSLMEDVGLNTGLYSEIGSTSTADTAVNSTNTVSTDDSLSSSSTTTEMKGHEIPEEGIAVLTFSTDPYDDFRGSMMEMIEARLRKQKHLEWDFMEDLLFCYLNMNEKKSFKYILCAFSDLLVSLRRGSGEGPARSCKNPGIWGRNKGDKF